MRLPVKVRLGLVTLALTPTLLYAQDRRITGQVTRTNSAIGLADVEISVLGLGWMLGGTFGVGTVVFALAIGPLVQVFLSRWDLALEAASPE